MNDDCVVIIVKVSMVMSNYDYCLIIGLSPKLKKYEIHENMEIKVVESTLEAPRSIICPKCTEKRK